MISDRDPWSRRRVCAGLAASALPAVAPGLRLAPAIAAETVPAIGFEAWLRVFRREALANGISAATLDAAFRDLKPNPRVIELDRRQPEFTQTFWSYFSRAVSESRIEQGRELRARHAKLLGRVQARYGVPEQILCAFWGLESNYGANTGGFPLIQSLATLAYDPRRAEFFRAQLLDALKILDEGHIRPERMSGSWAGAMGQMQFMPSTFTAYAIDADGDGRRDLWNSLPDAFASAAHYLASIGWRRDQRWGREVRLPEGFDWNLAGLDSPKPLVAWRDLGVRRADGGPLPVANFDGAIILPGGYRGPAFMVYENFQVILRWNRSVFYATAVGHLSDRIDGKDALVARPPADDRPLARGEIMEIQSRLGELGFEAGIPDGVVGAQTREAIRSFQKSYRLPPDGYPTISLLERLRTASGG